MNLKRIEHAEKQDQEFFKYVDIESPYQSPKFEHEEKTDPDKILVFADPHEPYPNETVFKHALDNEKDAETVIIAGDLGDYYSKSRFRKDHAVEFAMELRSVFVRMEWLSKHFKKVLIMVGNHDTRPQDRISDAFKDSLDLKIFTEQNLLEYFSTFFYNVKIVGHQLDHGSSLNLTHIYQHGDIIFTHGKISRVDGESILKRISEHLNNWKKVYQLKPYKIIAQAHNHRELKTRIGDEGWFLLPCSCNPYGLGLQYIFDAKMYGKPPQCGYSVFYQKDGITDYNKSRNVLL